MSIIDRYHSIQPGGVTTPAEIRPNRVRSAEFTDLLNEKLKISSHAETRIRSREIPWNEGLEKRISGGVEQARAKGSREALILADGVAVIANVKSNTIITAVAFEQLKEKIFTNIDSTVFV